MMTGAAERAMSAMVPKKSVQLLYFWEGLYKSPVYPAFVRYFEELFADVKQDRIYIYSIFNNIDPPPTILRDPGGLYVQFSGEHFYNSPEIYDINLISAADCGDCTIIPHTLAGADINIHNHWNRILNRPRVPPPEQTEFCSFIVSNGGPAERRQFFNMLNVRKKVDSWGGFQNNMGGRRPPAEQGSDEYCEFLGRYKFMIAFENHKGDYYLTEKLINAYAGGAIPIYWGCPQATKLLNPRAFLHIDSATVPDMADLVERVLALDADDEAYRRMYAEPLFIDNRIPDIFNVKVFSQHIAEVANEL